MTDRITRFDLQIDTILHDFIETSSLPGTGVDSDTFLPSM